jgi:hypothetical protein
MGRFSPIIALISETHSSGTSSSSLLIVNKYKYYKKYKDKKKGTRTQHFNDMKNSTTSNLID